MIAPFLQRCPVGNNQIRHHAGLVNKRAGADNDHIRIHQRLPQPHSRRQSVHRVGVMRDHQPGCAAVNIRYGAPPLRQRRRRRLAGQTAWVVIGIEQQPAAPPHAVHHKVERHHGGGVELAVAVGARRIPAAQCQGMQCQLSGQRLKKLGHRNPAQRRLRYLQGTRHGVGPEIIQRRRPLPVGHTRNIAARGTSRQHRPRQRQRRVPLGAGRNRQPLVGVGRRQRIPRVKVIMTPPVPRVFPGAKLAVPHCVGRRAAPGGQKITAETDQRIGVANVIVG